MFVCVSQEKDINSGLIGPLLICRPGTLMPRVLLQPGVQDLFLLFTIFDEKKSWYLDDNIKEFCTPPCQAKIDDPWFETSNKFAGTCNMYTQATLSGNFMCIQSIKYRISIEIEKTNESIIDLGTINEHLLATTQYFLFHGLM